MANEDLTKLKIEKKDRQGAPRAHKRALFWIVLFLLFVVAAFLLWGGLGPRVEIETTTVSQVYPSQGFTLLNASGYVVAQRKAAVASKATGRLEWLGVEEGSRVRAGEVLARLENRDVAAAREQAAANLVTAKAGLEQARAEQDDAGQAFSRQKELLSQGIVAQSEYDVAEARFKRAKAGVAGADAAVNSAAAALRGADVALEYTLIRAPFDAVVLTKDADVGDIVTPLGAAANAKAAVVTIADMKSLQVEADVSEANLGKVKEGQPCEIQLDALPDVRFRGVLHTVVPTADRSKATVMVKVRFLDPDRRILPEMSAKVAFLERPVAETEQRPKTSVSQSAVAARGGKQVVYLVKGDRVVEAVVTLGKRIGDQVEILSGVRPGDSVALKPLDKLKDGTKIKTAEK
ncbi:efflux RND transporter periplasmic adaptor subunit [Geomobilimonas luticola]|uniref:Efflux RND transporter periplasmic adaptor subunit n=1 Tax=Geomobilimonas luticola TaxID=1114878 RepID=A0ABS5SE79_9BACT|nr:efflux RND transporter periplasmic adaptor subunit [Geomobilimonas luticola]MBT0653673.1 efflux RND transporter periplasmic adaptor subunit [Geomobilimonas luticola]